MNTGVYFCITFLYILASTCMCHKYSSVFVAQYSIPLTLSDHAFICMPHVDIILLVYIIIIYYNCVHNYPVECFIKKVLVSKLLILITHSLSVAE